MQSHPCKLSMETVVYPWKVGAVFWQRNCIGCMTVLSHTPFEAVCFEQETRDLYNLFSTGLYGHSALYHGPSKAIYVFGGYVYSTDNIAVSNVLYALDIKNRSLNLRNSTWTILPSELNNKVCGFEWRIEWMRRDLIKLDNIRFQIQGSNLP